MEREPVKTPSRKARRTAAEIRTLISEYEKSGLSANGFSDQHKIRRAYFNKWLKRYRKQKPSKGFVPVQGVKEEPPFPQAALFAEYRGIRFYQAVDPSYLKSLVS
jgi:hypothetical protein